MLRPMRLILGCGMAKCARTLSLGNSSGVRCVFAAKSLHRSFASRLIRDVGLHVSKLDGCVPSWATTNPKIEIAACATACCSRWSLAFYC